MTSRTINLNSLINGTIDCSNNVLVTGRLDCSNNLTSLSGLKVKCTDISSNYTVLTKDYLIYVDTIAATGNVNITLPTASTVDKQVFYFVDGTGNCLSKNIIINTSGSDTINGETSLTMNLNYMTVGLLARSSTNSFIMI